MFKSEKFNILILVMAVSMVSLLLSSRWYSTEIRQIPYSLVSIEECVAQGGGPVCRLTLESDDGRRFQWDHFGIPESRTVYLDCKGARGDWHCEGLSGHYRGVDGRVVF